MRVAAVSAVEIERLYRRRFGAFVGLAAAVTGDHGDAVDVVQDSFAKALRKRRSIRSPELLEPLLWRVVLNTARDRRRGRRSDVLNAAEPAVTTNGYGLDASVRALLAELPERQREAIFLRYYADLDYKAIAELLGISAGTVAATLNAAHSALRERLEGARR
jgi:RNA polymerase sigma factor (sigma-70 family)